MPERSTADPVSALHEDCAQKQHGCSFYALGAKDQERVRADVRDALREAEKIGARLSTGSGEVPAGLTREEMRAVVKQIESGGVPEAWEADLTSGEDKLRAALRGQEED